MLLISQNVLLIGLGLSNRSFQVNLGNNFSSPTSVSRGITQRSILGPLLFLIYVNDMSQALKCHLFLYADDSYLTCQHKDINETEKQCRFFKYMRLVCGQ